MRATSWLMTTRLSPNAAPDWGQQTPLSHACGNEVDQSLDDRRDGVQGGRQVVGCMFQMRCTRKGHRDVLDLTSEAVRAELAKAIPELTGPWRIAESVGEERGWP